MSARLATRIAAALLVVTAALLAIGVSIESDEHAQAGVAALAAVIAAGHFAVAALAGRATVRPDHQP
jgi:hypothetical protein